MKLKNSKAIVLSLALSVSLYAQESFTLKEQSLEQAIKKIAAQAKMPYIADGKLLKGKTSKEIKNIEGLGNALNKILRGTELKAVIKKGTILIVKKEKEISKLEKKKEKDLQNDLGSIDVISVARTNISVDESSASIKVINQEQIQEQLSMTSNSSKVLENLVSSYSPSRQKMNGNGETVRGRTPLILIDGVPQSNPLRPTGREAHTIDFKMVESIEIINGATSSNGISGVGGVINIITKKPKKDSLTQGVDFQTTLPTSELSNETASYRAAYSISGQKDYFDYFASASFEDQGLYLDGNGDAVGVDNTQGDLMNSKSYDVLTKLGYWIDDNQNVKLLVNKYNIKNKNDYITVDGDKDKGILATSQKGTPEGNAPFNDVLTTSVAYNNADFLGMDLSAMVFNQEFEGLFGATASSSFQDSSISTDTIYDQSRVKSSKYGSKLTLNKGGLLEDKLGLTFGFDTLFDETFQDLYLTGRTYVPNTQYNVYSPFVLVSYDITDNLNINAGVRYEVGDIEVDSYTTVARYNSVFVQGGTIDVKEDLYNLGLVYDFKNDINIYANYSEGFTLPDIGRALRSINTEGVTLSSFSNLSPIITDNYELGLRGKRGIFDFEGTIYQSKSDFGSRVTTNSFGAYILKREKTKIKGLDLSLGVKADDNNNLNFLYSYSQGMYDSDQDGTVDTKLTGLNIAPNRLISKWHSKVNAKLSTLLQVNHAFDRTFDDSNRNFSGYTLVDLSTSYKMDNDTISVGISNLLDKQYVTYYSQSAVNDDSRYTAGRGRTITLGYSLKF